MALQSNLGTTSSMSYSLKKSAVNSRSYRDSITPINGSTFSAGSVIKIDIPSGRRNTFLDTSLSYLKFTVTNTSVTAAGAAVIAVPDGPASCFIQRLDIYHNSNLIESIDQYARLSACFHDAQWGGPERQSQGSFSGNAEGNGSVNITRTGRSLAVNQVDTYVFPLMSCVIGTLLDKYLPIGSLVGDLRVEITLASALNALLATNANDVQGYTIKDVEYVAHIVEVDSSVMDMIENQNAAAGYRLHGSSFRSYNTVLAATATSLSFLIPARFASLKTLFVAQQPSTLAGLMVNPATTMRIRPTQTQYNFKIGSLQVPQKPIKTGVNSVLIGLGVNCESWMELQKAFHAVGILGSSSITATTYEEDELTTGTYLIGQELESMAHRQDVLTSGVNTLSQNCYFEANYIDPLAGGVNVYCWAHYDILLEIINGQMRAKF